MSINCTNPEHLYVVAPYNEKKHPAPPTTNNESFPQNVYTQHKCYLSMYLKYQQWCMQRAERPDIPQPEFQTQYQGKHTLNKMKTNSGTF